MKKIEVHRAWARPEDPWSPWVKPILFAALDHDLAPRPIGDPPAWLVPGVIEPLLAAAGGGDPYRRSGNPLAETMLVVDLAGAEGTLAGVALARHGFSPIPLYNGLPEERAVTDYHGVMSALVDGAATVRDVAGGAPPAFLLDARRLVPEGPMRPGAFDNRWFSAPTDFPSADALWGAGLRRVVLIQGGDPWPAADLAPTLLALQRRGLALLLARADAGSSLAPLPSVSPPWPARLQHWIVRLFLKRRPDGAFGERLPSPSAG